MKTLLNRALEGLKRKPAPAEWLAAAACALFLFCASFFFAKISGFPDFSPSPFASPRLWLWVFIVFISPGITEEILFRCWILRFHDEVSRREYLSRWGISQLLYIAWHPFFLGLLQPARLAVFGNPRFLALAFLVGICASFLYLKSRSLWPSIFFHWSVVAGWYLFGGGFFLLHPG